MIRYSGHFDEIKSEPEDDDFRMMSPPDLPLDQDLQGLEMPPMYPNLHRYHQYYRSRPEHNTEDQSHEDNDSEMQEGYPDGYREGAGHQGDVSQHGQGVDTTESSEDEQEDSKSDKEESAEGSSRVTMEIPDDSESSEEESEEEGDNIEEESEEEGDNIEEESEEEGDNIEEESEEEDNDIKDIAVDDYKNDPDYESRNEESDDESQHNQGLISGPPTAEEIDINNKASEVDLHDETTLYNYYGKTIRSSQVVSNTEIGDITYIFCKNVGKSLKEAYSLPKSTTSASTKKRRSVLKGPHGRPVPIAMSDVITNPGDDTLMKRYMIVGVVIVDGDTFIAVLPAFEGCGDKYYALSKSSSSGNTLYNVPGESIFFLPEMSMIREGDTKDQDMSPTARKRAWKTYQTALAAGTRITTPSPKKMTGAAKLQPPEQLHTSSILANFIIMNVGMAANDSANREAIMKNLLVELETKCPGLKGGPDNTPLANLLSRVCDSQDGEDFSIVPQAQDYLREKWGLDFTENELNRVQIAAAAYGKVIPHNLYKAIFHQLHEKAVGIRARDPTAPKKSLNARKIIEAVLTTAKHIHPEDSPKDASNTTNRAISRFLAESYQAYGESKQKIRQEIGGDLEFHTMGELWMAYGNSPDVATSERFARQLALLSLENASAPSDVFADHIKWIANTLN